MYFGKTLYSLILTEEIDCCPFLVFNFMTAKLFEDLVR